MIKINNEDGSNYIKRVYERDFKMMSSIVFNSLLNKKSESNNYNKLYRFATEDMATYMPKLDNMNTYLSICGSSEQIFNGILLGAKNIDVFDINYFAKHGLMLRVAAIKALTKDELIKFYSSKLDLDLFYKILDYLDDYEKSFWYNIINCYGDVLINRLFYKTRLNIDQIIDINLYLQDNNYELIKRLIDDVNINFIESDLYNLIPFVKNKKYNCINLSNIYEYLNYDKTASIKKALTYKEFIDYLINNNLDNDGSIMFAYMYKWNRNVKDYFDILYRTNKELVSRYDNKIKKNLYNKGLTYQNLSYSMLYDVFKNFEEIITNTIIYGNSIEKNHDVALILRKGSYGNSKNNSR